METFDDKSEGKKSIHRAKTMFRLEKKIEISI